jgi:glycosyltransferase involved in cell wall biosynthesis
MTTTEIELKPPIAIPYFAPDSRDPIELSIVMPCLNEAETLATCIAKAQASLQEPGMRGEVIVADNGSIDGSQTIAAAMGARVVSVKAKGYGNALLGGIAAARGIYVIVGDADDSYDFSEVGRFVEQLRLGYELVMGNRFKGQIKRGAMPALHRYLGNPLLSGIGQLFFHSPCGDFHCGLRGFRRDVVTRLNLQTTGMEFASEMVVKASLHRLRIVEVPITLSPDGRSRPPHLRSWRDGWRHLRFLLLYSPSWLFFYPGMLLMLIGLLIGVWLLPGPHIVHGIIFDIHTLLYAAMAIVIGFQSVIFAAFTKIFAINAGLLPEDLRMRRLFHRISLEIGLLVGACLLISGLASSIYAFSYWKILSFGPLNPVKTLRVVIPAATLLALGCQVVFSSFFLSILRMQRRGPA